MKTIKVLIISMMLVIIFSINCVQICFIEPEGIKGFFVYTVINPDVIPFFDFWEWGQYLFLGIIFLAIGIIFVVKIRFFTHDKKAFKNKSTIICLILGVISITLCLNLKHIILANNTKYKEGNANYYSYVEIDGEKYYLNWSE